MKKLRWIGVIIGLLMVAVLLHAVGWTAVRQTLEWLGWGYGLVLLYPLSWIILNTLSWREALPLDRRKISFIRLIVIRLAGESFNSLLPSGFIGGEPLKAHLLSENMPITEAASSVLVAKSSQSVALVIFAVLGLMSVGRSSATSIYPPKAMLWALLILTTGITVFTVLLASGSFARTGRALHRITRWAWLQRQEDKLVALDTSLGDFYRHGKARFLLSIGWSLLAWLAGALELWMIFLLIGHPIAWRQAWFMGALAQVSAIIGLLAPAGVGFYEGGHYLAAKILGIPPALAVGASLIRRVREIFWDGIGIGFFWKLSKKEKNESVH